MNTAKATRRALLVPMLDFPSDFEEETNLWFDFDHVPERLSCDGIEFAERFQLTDIQPVGWNAGQRWMKYLNFYTLTSTDVLESEAYRLQYQRHDGHGGPWQQSREERQTLASRRSPARSLRTSWVRRDDDWTDKLLLDQAGPRTILVALRNDGGEHDAAANSFLDSVLIPELLNVPGVLGCERYQAAGPLVGGGARVGQSLPQPTYMDIVYLGTPEVAVSGRFRLWATGLDIQPELRAALTPVGYGVYAERPSPWRVTVR